MDRARRRRCRPQGCPRACSNVVPMCALPSRTWWQRMRKWALPKPIYFQPSSLPALGGQRRRRAVVLVRSRPYAGCGRRQMPFWPLLSSQRAICIRLDFADASNQRQVLFEYQKSWTNRLPEGCRTRCLRASQDAEVQAAQEAAGRLALLPRQYHRAGALSASGYASYFDVINADRDLFTAESIAVPAARPECHICRWSSSTARSAAAGRWRRTDGSAAAIPNFLRSLGRISALSL